MSNRKLGNTRNKVIMLCFSTLNDTAMLSFCGSHHCRVCPPQKTMIIFKTVCEISISMSEYPIYTHLYQWWQPELARKWTALFEVCLTWFFKVFKHGTSSAQSTAPLAFSGTTYFFKDYLNDVPHVTQGERDRDNPAFWVGTVLPVPVLPCRNVRSPCIWAQRGWSVGGTKITVCKCTLKIALVFQRLFFCSMLCAIVSSFATLWVLSGEWKNCHSSYPAHPPPNSLQPPPKRALKSFRPWGKKHFPSLSWILEVAQAGSLAWKTCPNIFKGLAKSQTRKNQGLTTGKTVPPK